MRYTLAGAVSATLFLLGLWRFLTQEPEEVRHLGTQWLRAQPQFRDPQKLRHALEGHKVRDKRLNLYILKKTIVIRIKTILHYTIYYTIYYILCTIYLILKGS